MKIQTQIGCTAGSFTVDGVPFDRLSPERQKEVEDRIFERLREGLQDGSLFLQNILEELHCDERDFGPTCDQCGDSVTTSTWNL